MRNNWIPTSHNGGERRHCDGFTISFAAHSEPHLVGLEFPDEGETALIDERDGVRGDILILNGDWRKEYDKIADKGYDACKAFYDSKKAKHRSRWSEDDNAGITAEEGKIILKAARALGHL